MDVETGQGAQGILNSMACVENDFIDDEISHFLLLKSVKQLKNILLLRQSCTKEMYAAERKMLTKQPVSLYKKIPSTREAQVPYSHKQHLWNWHQIILSISSNVQHTEFSHSYKYSYTYRCWLGEKCCGPGYYINTSQRFKRNYCSYILIPEEYVCITNSLKDISGNFLDIFIDGQHVVQKPRNQLLAMKPLSEWTIDPWRCFLCMLYRAGNENVSPNPWSSISKKRRNLFLVEKFSLKTKLTS